MPPGGPVISYMMCLGLKGFVSSPVPSAAAPVASTPKLSRIRTTAYAPIAPTRTRSSGIHRFLNSRNTPVSPYLPATGLSNAVGYTPPLDPAASWANLMPELKFGARRILYRIARPEVGWCAADHRQALPAP